MAGEIYWALGVFLLAGASDVADGYLARRFNWCSNLGKVLDPLADKLMQGTVVISLAIYNFIPYWLAIPFVLKDALMLLGGLFFFKKKQTVVVSSWFGKLAVCYYYLVIVLAILLKDQFAAHPVYLNILCALDLVILISVFLLYAYKYFFLKKKNPSYNERNVT